MNKNTHVETAQKGQATNKNIQPEKVVTALKNIDDIRKNKSKVPTGKVTILKETEARKKAREEQYRNFRINALKRRCKRMEFDDEKTAQYVETLKKQLDAPKEYSILVMFSSKDGAMMKEALTNAGINYKYHGDTYYSIDGDQNVLAKIREIAPPGAKIHPYAKKMESVLKDVEHPLQEKKSNYIAKNTDKSTTAKYRRLQRKADKLRKKQLDGMAANDHKLHAELQKEKRMTSRRKVAKKIKMLHKRLQKAALKANKKKTGTVVQLNAKKGSTVSKKASTSIKKAA